MNKRIPRLFIFAVIYLQSTISCEAISRISAASGSWSSSATWSPAGTPAPYDNITIVSGHTITVSSNQTANQITINANGTLTFAPGNALSVTGNLVVNGTVIMNGGNLSLTNYGRSFSLGSTASFTWDPANNTVSGATLFTNGIESFSPGSWLIIKKWYNYAVPLGSVVTGNFGNLELNSFNGTSIAEWNQSNQFQIHQVTGMLRIDQGWITLDKSGSITNTTIGSIFLKNINSSFYAHHGTHPSAFTLTTSSVINQGGNFFGIHNGNGNITLHVTGNFTNSGNVKIINNSGIAGVSNGNANIQVDSTYTQTAGDSRFIYNVATTNSGLYNASIRNLNLNGGIFMGQSGCRTAGGICALNIIRDFNISYTGATDKFRGTSISSIGSNVNAVQFIMNIGGDLNVTGNLAAEITSATSSGREDVLVSGATNFTGCNVNFNYGSMVASHASGLTFNGNVLVNGGIVFLSRNNGLATIAMNGNLNLTSGQVTIKGGNNSTSMTVQGNYTQTGGQLYFHNGANACTSPVSFNLAGNFSHSSGLFSFDSYASNSTAHIFNFSGANFHITGNGLITRAGTGNSTTFGIINYSTSGVTNYTRTGLVTTHLINQVKQVIKNGCTLKLATGNLQAGSFPAPVADFIKVETGGSLNCMANQVLPNGLFAASGLILDSGAALITQRPEGFYDGTGASCISSSISYSLHPNSIVEYNGSSNQVLTHNPITNATPQHQFGILKINLANSTGYVVLNAAVIARTRLILAKGGVRLNGQSLTINDGNMNAIQRTNGYINSELNGGQTAGTVTWKNITMGLHEFPFGTDHLNYIPVWFIPATGTGSHVKISTYATAGTDNSPLPSTNGTTVNFAGTAIDFATHEVLDRWWVIDAPGMTGSLTLKYRATENTISSAYQTGSLGLIQWAGSSWNTPSSTGLGVLSGIGTVSSETISDFTAFGISRNSAIRAAGTFTSFYAEQVGSKVSVNWSTLLEINSDYFVVERSYDFSNFYEVGRKNAAGNSQGMISYNYVDAEPVKGIAWYRVRLIAMDGTENISGSERVHVTETSFPKVTLEKFGPNPFENNFFVNYQLTGDGEVNFELSDSKGAVIYQTQKNDSSGLNRFEYDDGIRLHPGIYFLKIIFKGRVVVQKLLKK